MKQFILILLIGGCLSNPVQNSQPNSEFDNRDARAESSGDSVEAQPLQAQPAPGAVPVVDSAPGQPLVWGVGPPEPPYGPFPLHYSGQQFEQVKQTDEDVKQTTPVLPSSTLPVVSSTPVLTAAKGQKVKYQDHYEDKDYTFPTVLAGQRRLTEPVSDVKKPAVKGPVYQLKHVAPQQAYYHYPYIQQQKEVKVPYSSYYPHPSYQTYLFSPFPSGYWSVGGGQKLEQQKQVQQEQPQYQQVLVPVVQYEQKKDKVYAQPKISWKYSQVPWSPYSHAYQFYPQQGGQYYDTYQSPKYQEGQYFVKQYQTHYQQPQQQYGYYGQYQYQYPGYYPSYGGAYVQPAVVPPVVQQHVQPAKAPVEGPVTTVTTYKQVKKPVQIQPAYVSYGQYGQYPYGQQQQYGGPQYVGGISPFHYAALADDSGKPADDSDVVKPDVPESPKPLQHTEDTSKPELYSGGTKSVA